ncbi:MAG: galactokinase [Anaerolineae bacterium]|nr:galactokinase [Anaerolineae bacterium]
MTLREKVITEFTDRFGGEPTAIVRAPGRVNLIGEHTDYNDGFVLPMAIDRAAWIALRPRADGAVNVQSLDFEGETQFSLNDLKKGANHWGEYVKGIAWALREAGHTLTGWDGVIGGDVPGGAGLSSSAALEMAVARAFAVTSGFAWDAGTMAKLGQKVENQWIGVNSGIMDQMISAAGKAGYALLIDCRSLETQLVPLPPETVIVILDTATRRGLVGSAYNERREQCETAARFFGVKALRDLTIEQFEARASELDELPRKRARHVITENARVLQAADAMRNGDAAAMGKLMIASHTSMRDDFQISSDALNAMVESALREDSCYGARMTGGGFAGCAVALVKEVAAEVFAARVAASYTLATGLTPNVYVCQASEGAAVVS